jgi:hypothetical protein
MDFGVVLTTPSLNKERNVVSVANQLDAAAPASATEMSAARPTG